MTDARTTIWDRGSPSTTTSLRDWDKESTSPWYRFRDPVAGNRFHEGSVGDRDDMASFPRRKGGLCPERIETRTHYALFHCSDRTDGASIGDFDLAATAGMGPSGEPIDFDSYGQDRALCQESVRLRRAG